MSERSRILARLRSVSVESVELPDLSRSWTTVDDPAERFSELLTSVGGLCELVAGEAELGVAVRRLAEKIGAERICCEVAGVIPDSSAVGGAEAHDFANLDLSVVRGDLAVAENAAVWVSDAGIRDRAVLFLAEHVALVVDRRTLVSNMHQAYERIDIAARPFGAFISGPSKTADIEQALVIGAHGPRSLTVFLLD